MQLKHKVDEFLTKEETLKQEEVAASLRLCSASSLLFPRQGCLAKLIAQISASLG